jgi:hypothetical protein
MEKNNDCPLCKDKEMERNEHLVYLALAEMCGDNSEVETTEKEIMKYVNKNLFNLNDQQIHFRLFNSMSRK